VRPDLLSDRESTGQGLTWRGHPVDQAQLVTAFGVQLRAGDQQFLGHVQGKRADGAEERAGAGDDAPPGRTSWVTVTAMRG
jgi:hypothetical protein